MSKDFLFRIAEFQRAISKRDKRSREVKIQFNGKWEKAASFLTDTERRKLNIARDESPCFAVVAVMIGWYPVDGACIPFRKCRNVLESSFESPFPRILENFVYRTRINEVLLWGVLVYKYAKRSYYFWTLVSRYNLQLTTGFCGMRDKLNLVRIKSFLLFFNAFFFLFLSPPPTPPYEIVESGRP